MITYVKGDLFESPAKVLVNTVNTVGVMGKGVALEFKKRYPEMFVAYKNLCDTKKITVGSLFLWKKNKKWVLLFPTKQHWRNPSKLDYIEKGLIKFRDNWDRLGADSIAFPRLGCGNGNLNWDDVRPLMEKYLRGIPLQIYIYVDIYNDPVPEHLNQTEIDQWLNGEAGLTGFEKFQCRFSNWINSHDIKELKEMDNSQICDLWNFIRDGGIITKEDIPTEYQTFADSFLEISRKLGYLAKVIISNDGKHFGSKPNAYQYIAD